MTAEQLLSNSEQLYTIEIDLEIAETKRITPPIRICQWKRVFSLLNIEDILKWTYSESNLR